ncbi:hypothetical protein HPB48_025497 [Haemaphysalis longicornis]|uniref:Peptidase M13 N-terminal domain-containing protein n=1 Tax=Haemaphysalis longicornis TaxID=44386 RepID=A0A9J6H7U2_HAELO|nr:hypothetical protein HPB48_025497 [Haemaphysalis longicornis]
MSKPGRGAIAADLEKPAHRLSHPNHEGGSNSSGYVKEPRPSVPLEALRSGVGAFEVKRPSRGEVVDGEADPSFYSAALMGLGALDPGEKLASVGGVDRRLRTAFQASSAPMKAEAGRIQSSLYAAVSQGSLVYFDAELPKPHDMTVRVPGTTWVDSAHHKRWSKRSMKPQSHTPLPVKRPSAARSARASSRAKRPENWDVGRSSHLSPFSVKPIQHPEEQTGSVNSVAKGAHVDAGEAATDSTCYNASERLTATGKHARLGTMARHLSSVPGFTKASDKTGFLHPDLEYAGVGPKKINSRILGKTTSTEEYFTALSTAVEFSGPCLVYRAPKDVCSHAMVQEGPLTSAFSHRPRMYAADPYRASTKVAISRLPREGKGQRNSPERYKLSNEAYGTSSSEDLLPFDDVRFGALPRRGEMSAGRHICPYSPDKIARSLNLVMGDIYAPDIENRSPSSAARDAWRATIPGLLMASSPTMSEGGDSVRLVLFPKAADFYTGGAERALFPGVSDILDRQSLLSAASEFVMSDLRFRTARSLSEPNIVAVRPPAVHLKRSFSDSMIVNASSDFSMDSVSPVMSSPGHATVRKTIDLAEDRRLPKVAPKKKRPKPAVALKPTKAQINVSRNYPAEAFPSAPSPESTGMEVSMKAKSHAKELCLSMLGVAVTVLGLVFVSKSVGRNIAGIRIFTTGQVGTSDDALTRRVATESSGGPATIPFSVPPRDFVCNLTRCHEEGRFLASSLSWDRDPCVDFYGFACAKWAEARAASAAVAGGASASVVEDMERHVERRAARLLATARSAELAPLRRMHDACNDVNAIHAAGWAPLGALLQLCHLPHWPYDQPSTVSAWTAAARAHQYTGAETLISVHVTPHPLRANRSISALDRPRLALRAADLVAQDFHWLEDTANTVMTAFRERPRQLAREAVAVAVQIARLAYSRDALSDVRMYRVSNLGPFPQLLEFLSTLFANVSSVHASTEVVLRAEGFLSDLLDLADERRNRALLNYIGLQVVVHCSAFLPDAVGLQAMHARLLFPDEASAGYVPRERLCVRQAARTMPFLFFYALRLVFGGEATVRALTAALETLRRCLADHFSAVTLGDSPTRSQFAAIVRETRLHVMGPPVVANESLILAHAEALPTAGDDGPLAWFARVSAHVSQLRVMRLSRYVWPGGAFDRDCSSDLQANEIFVPPLFVNASGGTWDRGGLVLQMAQLGGRFARCVLLMLLSGVSNRANRELVTRGWWSDGAKASLSALRRCLARRSDDDTSSAKAPMSRVADAVALPALLVAFARDLHSIAGPEASFRLPHVQDLVPEQLFFAAYALARCRREQPARRRETSDDVNAALRQSPAFRAAFECRTGLPMSPDAPCIH